MSKFLTPSVLRALSLWFLFGMLLYVLPGCTTDIRNPIEIKKSP